MTQMPKIAVVVGDDEHLRIDLARGLASLGFDSILLDDASDVDSCLGSAKPDVVLLATGASRSDPISLVSRAARLFAAYRAPVVLCAGSGDIATLGAAIIEGADECMIAPVDPDLLRFKLEQTGVLSAPL